MAQGPPSPKPEARESLLDLPLTRVPFVVLDVETTGLVPGYDRIVEISVVQPVRNGEPKVWLDTLVNPEREVGATEIHGITDEDVQDAPTFTELRGALAGLLARRVVVAHNADFDLRFLRSEFGPSFGPRPLPYLCTMEFHHFLRPGARRNLAESYSTFLGERLDVEHRARTDAEATARVLNAQLAEARQAKRLRRLRDLLDAECGRFAASLCHAPPAPPASVQAQAPAKPREGASRTRARSPEGIYLEEVVSALADLEIDDEELAAIKKLRSELELGDGVVRALHAKVYTSMMLRYTEEGILDESERGNLRRLHEALRTLGWAPGD